MEFGEGTIVAHRYRLIEWVGEGLTGRVYRAWDSVREDEIAVKFLHNELVLENGGFQALIPLLSKLTQLHHPNIANVFDFNEYQGWTFFCQEWIQGTTFQSLFAPSSPDKFESIRLPESSSIIRQVVAALTYASAILPHGTMNSRNIWLLRGGQIRITDFGLHALSNPIQVRNLARFNGTDLYLAPEWVEADSPMEPEKTDQYALGVFLRDLDSLKLPEKKSKWSPFNPNPNRLHWIQRKLTSRQSDDRFSDWKEIESAVDRCLVRQKFGSLQALDPINVHSISIWTGLILVMLLGFFLMNPNPSGFNPANHQKEFLDSIDLQILRLDADKNQLVRESAGWVQVLDKALKDYGAGSDRELVHLRWEIENRLNRGQRELARLAGEEIDLLLIRQSASIGKLMDCIRKLKKLQLCLREWNQMSPHLSKLGYPADPSNIQPDPLIQSLAEGLPKRTETKIDSLLASIEERRLKAASFLKSETSREKATFDGLMNHHHYEPILKTHEIERVFASTHSVVKQENWLEITRTLATLLPIYRGWVEELKAVPEPTKGQRINSIGMRLVEVDDLWVSVWETRIMDFARFIQHTGIDSRRLWRENSQTNSLTHPVVSVERHDANRFGKWLTERERRLGWIPKDREYRLPTDREWSRMVGIEGWEDGETPMERSWNDTPGYPWGDRPERTPDSGNYHTWPSIVLKGTDLGRMDPWLRTSPVGSFAPNRFGLFDLGGNVWEWVRDAFSEDLPSIENKTIRGGGWNTISLDRMRSNFRNHASSNGEDIGFRVVLAPVEEAK